MLVQMKLLKRQDIVNLLLRIVKPANDQVIVKVFLGPEDLDSFVFALGKKKTVTKLAKETSDLYSYTTEKKNVDKLGLSDSYVLFSEIGEVTPVILDQRVISILTKFEDFIDFIHISDQFCGPRLPE